jgi:Mrp family chromosome partitioning ATPase
VSKIRDAMRKSEGEYRATSTARDLDIPAGARTGTAGPRGLVPALSSDVLAHYEAIGKQIEVALGQGTTRTLIFTGAVGGDGVSTVVAQYAEMLSRRGERVLLVDGNPRHPSLHRYFNLPDAPGLAEYIAGTAPQDVIVHATGFANLSLVPLGRCADRSQAERITEELGGLLEQFQGTHEYVLVDTDYVGSPFLSQSAVGAGDGVVFVIRAGKTNRQVAGRACDTVRRIGGQILGVVLNRREFPIPDFIYRRL